ncbi:MAG: hypothetical protein H2069_06055 [Legionella sp.]|nr:hypothetical protein [Legionella sp.]
MYYETPYKDLCELRKARGKNQALLNEQLWAKQKAISDYYQVNINFSSPPLDIVSFNFNQSSLFKNADRVHLYQDPLKNLSARPLIPLDLNDKRSLFPN